MMERRGRRVTHDHGVETGARQLDDNAREGRGNHELRLEIGLQLGSPGGEG